MIASEILDLPDYIDAATIKVHAPTRVIFICGGAINKPDQKPGSLRDAFMRVADRSPLKAYLRILAEDIEAFFPTGEYQELLKFESDIAQICELLLLFSESAGSLAELGVFAMDPEVAPKMMVIIDDKNYGVKKSFIKLGPLYSLTMHYGEDAVCVLSLADINLDGIDDVGGVDLEALLQKLDEPLETRLATAQEPSTFDATRNGHVTKLITGLIQHYSALTIEEIEHLLNALGVPKPISDIKKHIMCAEVFGWILGEKRGLKTFYAAVARNAAFTFAFRRNVERRDRSRWRSDIREYWKAREPERFKAISTAAARSVK